MSPAVLFIMGILTPSSIISEIRGDVGNVSYSRNRYGPFVRSKINQTNPSTTYQETRRAAMAAAVTAWQGLSDSEYKQWHEFVSQHKFPGRLPGRTRRSAWNEFANRYINRSLVNGSITDFSPLPTCRKFPWISGVEIGEDSLAVSFDSNEATGFVSLVAYASVPMSPGIRSLNPSWCVAISATDTATQSGTLELYTDYFNRLSYTGDPNGKRIFIALKAVNTDNYAESLKVFSSAIVSGWPVINDTFDDTFDETFI